MLYPLFTYEDGTEVTASKPDANGNIFLYIEKFDVNKDDFINATITLPGATIKSSKGYNSEDLAKMTSEYSELQEDIIGYVIEKVEQSA